MKPNSRTNVPNVTTVTFGSQDKEQEKARRSRIEDILTTMMADYAYAKAKGRV